MLNVHFTQSNQLTNSRVIKVEGKSSNTSYFYLLSLVQCYVQVGPLGNKLEVQGSCLEKSKNQLIEIEFYNNDVLSF